MGSACTSQAVATDSAIQRELDTSRKDESSICQLLVMGPPGVGKSTIIKQLKINLSMVRIDLNQIDAVIFNISVNTP